MLVYKQEEVCLLGSSCVFFFHLFYQVHIVSITQKDKYEKTVKCNNY